MDANVPLLNRQECHFRSHLVELRTSLLQLSFYAGPQILGMESIENKEAPYQGIIS